MKTLKLKIKKIYIPVRTTGLFAAAIDQWRGLSWRFDLGPEELLPLSPRLGTGADHTLQGSEPSVCHPILKFQY